MPLRLGFDTKFEIEFEAIEVPKQDTGAQVTESKDRMEIRVEWRRFEQAESHVEELGIWNVEFKTSLVKRSIWSR